ncbi:hypothetical protein SDC9_174947 [bioreactor metagenome]|uniref:SpoOB alpha-helical domain-containing protein n=1 Tax=bioreactor metagenome TaxID=1076179 RepID=A0A645GV43_9ZZZZ
MILQIIVMSLFGIIVKVDMNNFRTSIIVNVTIIFLSAIISRYLPSFNRKLEIKVSKKILIYLATNLFGYILITKVLWDYDNNIILKKWISFVLIISAMFAINAIMYFYIVKIEQGRKEAELRAKYSEVLSGITNEIRGRQHDFKNHLNVINGLIELYDENKNLYKVKNYINSLSYSMQGLESIIYIDNSILIAILYGKFHEANKANIKFIYEIKNSLLETSLKDYELVEVLSNLITMVWRL